MCFSAINVSGPADLPELLLVYTPSRSSSDTRLLKIQQYKHNTHGFHTFSCFGPHIWNSLKQDLSHCSTLSSFKAELETFLFSQPQLISIPSFYYTHCVCDVCASACVRACVRVCEGGGTDTAPLVQVPDRCQPTVSSCSIARTNRVINLPRFLSCLISVRLLQSSTVNLYQRVGDQTPSTPDNPHSF